MRLRNVHGNVTARVGYFHLDLKGTRAGVDVMDSFGNVTAHVESVKDGAPLRFQTVTGGVNLSLSKPLADRLSVALKSEEGVIHYGNWKKKMPGLSGMPGFSNHQWLYVGTYSYDLADRAQLQVRTACGDITIRQQPSVNESKTN